MCIKRALGSKLAVQRAQLAVKRAPGRAWAVKRAWELVGMPRAANGQSYCKCAGTRALGSKCGVKRAWDS